MVSLFTYMKQVQRFIADSRTEKVDPGDIVENINRARREVAMRGECIRVLTPIQGSITNAIVTTAGAGYTSPTVVITPPDFPGGDVLFPAGAQATGTAVVSGASIAAVNITFGGKGYFMPQITISDPTGTGAVIKPVLNPLWTTNQSEEIYHFSSIPIAQFPGVESIFQVKSISMLYSNWRFSLPIYSFSEYQAMIRNYPYQYQYVPSIGAQFGQGNSGSFYLYPIASQQYQMEWDCFCLPQDLISDQSVEAIPDPWTDAVPHFAAYLTFLEMQNMNSARLHQQLFNEFMSRYSAYTRPGRRVNPYGRY
jgi:hypothetical protein